MNGEGHRSVRPGLAGPDLERRGSRRRRRGDVRPQNQNVSDVPVARSKSWPGRIWSVGGVAEGDGGTSAPKSKRKRRPSCTLQILAGPDLEREGESPTATGDVPTHVSDARGRRAPPPNQNVSDVPVARSNPGRAGFGVQGESPKATGGRPPPNQNVSDVPVARSKSWPGRIWSAGGSRRRRRGDVPPQIKRSDVPVARSKSGRAGFGAGDGNRTRVNSLEGYRTTIVLHPLVVARAGFEPAISGLKGRRPSPLDERAPDEPRLSGSRQHGRGPIRDQAPRPIG